MDNLKKIFYLEKSYLLILIFSLIIRSMNIYSLLPSTLDNILFSCLAFLGFFVVLYELYNFLMEKNKDWTDWLILIFLLAFLISIILNRNYGMSSNLKLLVWNNRLYKLYCHGRDVSIINYISSYVSFSIQLRLCLWTRT